MANLDIKSIEALKTLYCSGEYTLKELGRMFGITMSNAHYWINDKYRFAYQKKQRIYQIKLMRQGKTWNQKNPERNKEYMKNYIKNRYHTDPEFRQKHKDSAIRYQNRKYHEDEKYREKILKAQKLYNERKKR
jgi:hypothetical protein